MIAILAVVLPKVVNVAELEGARARLREGAIGNVPLAAAPREGGISVGGVIAFLFADLLALPLVLLCQLMGNSRRVAQGPIE